MADEQIPFGMGRCEMTGKIVAEDELVEIHGKRVSAEGKQLLLERLKAGEVMPGELERPSVLRRFGCMWLDGLVLLIPVMAIGAVTGVATFLHPGAAGTQAAQGIAGLLGTAVGIGYYGLMHGMYGQSLGKMAGKLKVIRIDGAPMDIQTGMIRAVVYQGTGLISAVLAFTGIGSVILLAQVLVALFALANVIVALVDQAQQRAIHDLVAGTRVVVINS